MHRTQPFEKNTMSEFNTLASHPATEELRALYDGSTDGIIIADVRELRVLHANRVICRMLGYSNDELLSLSVTDFHPPETHPRAQAAFKAMSQREREYGLRTEIQTSYLHGIPAARRELDLMKTKVLAIDFVKDHIAHQIF